MSIEIVPPNEYLQSCILKPSQDIRIYIDSENFIPDGKLQLYLQMEPEAISAKRQFLLNNYKQYHAILTFDSVVLAQCPNAIYLTFYTQTWIHEDKYKNIDLSKKKFGISMLVGAKRMTPAHDLRLQLYFSQEHLQCLPITFFRSCAPPFLPEITKNPFLESKEIHAKYVLFETFQFHIAMENSRQENYFTEKLIDCLITKTIPIYYGCPNIQDFFDTTGWILLESGTPQEFLDKCIVLNKDYYNQYEVTIEENYKRAMIYKENIQRLNKTLSCVPRYLKSSLETS